MEPRLKARDQA